MPEPPRDPFDMVLEVAQGMPGVKAATRYDGAPVLKAGGVFLAGMAAHASAEPGTLVVRAEREERERLLDEAPETYYLTAYYRRHPVVLVRLSRAGRDVVRELLAMSSRIVMAKTRRGRGR